MITLYQTNTRLKSNDLDGLTGKNWSGSLIYRDYSTQKLVSIPTALTVTVSVKGTGSYNFKTSYPKEPSHDNLQVIAITNKGQTIDGENVKARTLLPEGTLTFVTERKGVDNDREALFRFTYRIGKTSFSRKQEVCYVGDSTWFMRNELSLKVSTE
ncbi:hypothetical protein [Chitinophaga nivalis]|uniref:Uncharacterized protein n=1 Tax=Chitinophaga nivalis TaxID=2991709 RepID=A0ABT3IN37_9BACT|nr:hypothetical protein [Chitinophaga nivalis]MCW3464916.1 hypothetical protein [Chitinophaga nivalis]MCW3485392.1 hypothetical protein [Chitinophaga nivalis]